MFNFKKETKGKHPYNPCELENNCAALSDISLNDRVSRFYETTGNLSERLTKLETFVENVEVGISTLSKENDTLKIEIESAKKAIWKLENPPIYRVGDTPNATLTIVEVEFKVGKSVLSQDDNGQCYWNSEPQPYFLWEYKAFDSKTKTIKLSNGKF